MSNKPESSASITKIKSAKDYRKDDLALQRAHLDQYSTWRMIVARDALLRFDPLDA